MKISLLSDDAIRLEDDGGPMTVEAATAEQSYSPFHMLGSSLALCTFSVLHSWASHANIEVARLSVDVDWTFAEKPHRVGAMNVTLTWPGLPEARMEAARRAAALCAVHATLTHPPEITVKLAGGAA